MKHKKQIQSILVQINQILVKHNLRTFSIKDIDMLGDGQFWDIIITNKKGYALESHRRINDKLDDLRNSIYKLMS